jgi:hypothetical protein
MIVIRFSLKLFYNNETKNDDFEKYKRDIKLKIYNL